jgi:hypothetical protein
MTFPLPIVKAFAVAEEVIQQLPWFNADWSCCSGLWKTERYPDAVVFRLTKRNWSSVFPVSLHKGGEIQYAAWIDEKLHRRSTVRVEMHIFSFLTHKKIKKGDFTEPFRTRNQSVIKTFGFHDTDRGPAVPYAGEYKYKDIRDLQDFLIRDFSNFTSLADSIDEYLAMVGVSNLCD